MHRSFVRAAGLASGVAALAFPTLAAAAALERAVPSFVRLFYEDGNYGEIGAVYTHPDLDGKNAVAPPNPVTGFPGGFVSGNTGNLLGNDWKFSAAFKGVLNPQLSYVLVFDQP
ncbi:MAG: hypothetical protein H0T41_15775 [Rhodobacteraceae bacterium]|nr:hypothetical protein [Paracoccaceae bacterium]